MTLPSRADAGGIVVLEEEAPARSGTLKLAGASHPGLVRERNEDRLLIDAAHGVLAVVDGMGGAAAGEVAAETALGALSARLAQRRGTPEDRVREAITSANNEIARLARENPEWQGMGCVLTLAIVERGVVTVGHVGDSRLYRLHGGRLDKLTHDHSPVGEREDQGEISERDAMRHPRRNEVYRSVGAEPRDAADREWIEVLRFPLEREDAILICSDGLTDLVPAGEIARVVREHAGDERALVQRLVDAANAAGGKDNVTVALAAADRFAADFVRPRAALPKPVDRRAPGERDVRRPGAWTALTRGRSTFFVLGALTGIALYALLPFAGIPQRPDTIVAPDPKLIAVKTRHLVGPGREFRTIGDALAAARPGDTIAVAPGRYREQVRLEDGITLLATVPGRAVLEPPAPGDGSGPVAALVAEGLGSGRVSGLAITGSTSSPIDFGIVLRAAAVTVENVEVRGAKVAGVAIEDAGGAALLASHIHDNPGSGIVISGAGAPLVIGNRVLDNGNGNPTAPGIEVQSGARPRIVGNIVAGSGAEAVRGVPTRSPLLDANRIEESGRAASSGSARVRVRR